MALLFSSIFPSVCMCVQVHISIIYHIQKKWRLRVIKSDNNIILLISCCWHIHGVPNNCTWYSAPLTSIRYAFMFAVHSPWDSTTVNYKATYVTCVTLNK